MSETKKLVRTVFSGLAALAIEDVEDAGDVIVVRASTKGDAVECPACGTPTRKVRAFHERMPADVPIDGRRVLVRVRMRRMMCPVTGCARQTFREQVPGLLERYERRTVRLREQVRAVVRELAGRASARLLPALGIAAGRDTALRTLLGIDDFALRRSRDYATVFIDAATGARIDVVPGRGAEAVADWLRTHPGCRQCAGTGRRPTPRPCGMHFPTPSRSQTGGTSGTAWPRPRPRKSPRSACWASATGLQDGPRARTTAERWAQVHGLLEKGVGLMDCSRRLNLSLNTVKRYARASAPERLQRVPKYRPTLVDPYREHLRARRAAEPGVPVQQLPREIREQGYQGSSNLLTRYLNQGRAEDERPHLSPRRAARLLLTRPDRLTPGQQERLDQLAAACPEITAALVLIRAFAALLKPDEANGGALDDWAHAVRAADLPHVHSFVRGIEQDRDAAVAAFTMPHHNGRTEGVNTRTKMLKRQMYGRAGFTLLRHRILLG